MSGDVGRILVGIEPAEVSGSCGPGNAGVHDLVACIS